jgi:hypothetical protein
VRTKALKKMALMASLLVGGTAFVGAQAAAPRAPAAPPEAVTATTAQTPSTESYAYDSAGRRDPFVSLLSRSGEPTGGGKKLSGLGAWTTSEVMLRGVMQSRGSYVAILSVPDGKTYTARANDRLLDGILRSVTPTGIVIMQEVNDPLSLVKQREVRKGLRTPEDGK